MVYGTYIYSVHGVYKPTNITEGVSTLHMFRHAHPKLAEAACSIHIAHDL